MFTEMSEMLPMPGSCMHDSGLLDAKDLALLDFSAPLSLWDARPAVSNMSLSHKVMKKFGSKSRSVAESATASFYPFFEKVLLIQLCLFSGFWFEVVFANLPPTAGGASLLEGNLIGCFGGGIGVSLNSMPYSSIV